MLPDAKLGLGGRLSLHRDAPAFDFRQLRLRPIDHHLAATEMDRTAPAVDRNPVTLSDRLWSKLRTMPVHIHRQFSATNNARLVQFRKTAIQSLQADTQATASFFETQVRNSLRALFQSIKKTSEAPSRAPLPMLLPW